MFYISIISFDKSVLHLKLQEYLRLFLNKQSLVYNSGVIVLWSYPSYCISLILDITFILALGRT